MEIRKVFGTALLAVVMAFQTNEYYITRNEYKIKQFEQAECIKLKVK